jgi:hypothetical protein
MTIDRPSLRRSLQARGPRPPDDVWDRYLRPARWPEWSPQIRKVDYPSAFLSAGTPGVVHGPGGIRIHFRILDVNPGAAIRDWSWSVTTAGIELRLKHTVEAVAGGTRTGLQVEGFAPAVLLYLPAASWALHRLVH